MGRSKPDREITFEWHIETVSGEEGKAVKQAQARAIRDLAEWLHARCLQRERGAEPEAGEDIAHPADTS